MNNRGAMFAQAARGPILLIVVGVLFALQQAGILSVARSWPLLIITIGVMKLIERLLMGNQPYQPSPSYAPPGAYQAPGPQAPYGGYRPPQPYTRGATPTGSQASGLGFQHTSQQPSTTQPAGNPPAPGASEK
jgi:hypothetical protein